MPEANEFFSFVRDRMNGFYPNSTILTSLVLSEMAWQLEKAGVATIDDFKFILNRYRERCPADKIQVPPNVKQLISCWESRNQGPSRCRARTDILLKLGMGPDEIATVDELFRSGTRENFKQAYGLIEAKRRQYRGFPEQSSNFNRGTFVPMQTPAR